MSEQSKSAENKKEYEEWEDLREEALERDGHECVFCGTTEKEHRKEHDQSLDVHRFIPPEHGGEDTLDNVAAMCHSCHMLLSNRHAKALEKAVDMAYTNELMAFNELFEDNRRLGRRLHEQLENSMENHPLFTTKLGFFDENPNQDKSVIYSHEVDGWLTDDVTEPITSEWEMVALFGYMRGIQKATDDLQTYSGVPYDLEDHG